MKLPSSSCRCTGVVLVLVAWAAVAMPSLAQHAGPARSPGGAEFTRARDAARVVVRYVEHPGELAGDLPGTTLEIYGDGRARIRYPAHMKRAGEYELRLGEAELDALVGELLDDGLADFDPNDVGRRRRDIATRRRGEPTRELHFRSDETQLSIDLDLERYRGAAGGPSPGRKLEKQVRYRGLREDARRYGEIEALQGLSRAQGRLRAVMGDPRRRRVTGSGGEVR